MNERMRSVYVSLLTLITIICILIGTFRFLGFSSDGSGRRKGEEFALEEFSELTVSLGDADVIVEKGREYQAEIVGSSDIQYALKDGRLSISGGKARTLRTNRSGSRVIITVPDDAELTSVDIQTGLGNITVDGIRAKEAGLGTDAGNITVRKSRLDEAEAESNLGNIILKDTEFSNFTAYTDLGNVDAELSVDRDSCSLSLRTDLGTVTVGKERKGSEYNEEKDGLRRFSAESDLGNIRVGF